MGEYEDDVIQYIRYIIWDYVCESYIYIIWGNIYIILRTPSFNNNKPQF